MRRTFAVGKLTPDATEILVVDRKEAPIAGPWRLRAVVRASREPGRPSPPTRDGLTVH